MSGEPATPGAQYRFAAGSLIELMRSLDTVDWSQRVPCTPAWTIRDLLSHVAGIPDDALNGRLDGVATDPWTAAQVERNRDLAVGELLDRWETQTGDFAAVLDAMGSSLAPFDCHTHEHDVRHALGRPGNRDNVIVEQAGTSLAQGFDLGFDVTVELDDGRTFTSGAGDAPGVTLRGVTKFELFRSRVGRRSRAQVEAYDWSGDPERIAAVIGDWFRFGPSEIEIVE